MDPIKIVTPISLALVGLSIALFLNNIVFISPNLGRAGSPLFQLSEVRGFFSSFFPLGRREPKGNFSGLIGSPSPAALYPTTFSSLATAPTLSNPSPAPPNLSFPDTLEITDAQINTLITQLIPASTPVRNVQIKFVVGKVLISGELLSPIAGKFNAEAAVNLENGLPVVKITKASLGSFPIPTFFLGSLEVSANTAIRGTLASQNIVKIKKLEITEGKILFSVSL